MEAVTTRPSENVEEPSPKKERTTFEGGAPVEDTPRSAAAPADLSSNPIVAGLQSAMGATDRGKDDGKKKKKQTAPAGSGVLDPKAARERERQRRQNVREDERYQDREWKDRAGMREVYRLDPAKVTGSATIVGAIPQDELATDGNSLGHAFASVKGQGIKEAMMPFQSSETQRDYEADRWQEAFRQDRNRAGNITRFVPSGGEDTPATEITQKIALIVGNENYMSGSGYGDLPGAKRDADQMAAYYQGQGYLVMRLNDLNGKEMRGAIRTCQGQMKPGGMMAFYYAGHGAPGGLNGVLANNGPWLPETEDLLPNSTLWGLVSAALSGGWHVTVVTDSCHSGSIHDQHTLVRDNYDIIEGAMTGHEVTPVY